MRAAARAGTKGKSLATRVTAGASAPRAGRGKSNAGFTGLVARYGACGPLIVTVAHRSVSYPSHPGRDRRRPGTDQTRKLEP